MISHNHTECVYPLKQLASFKKYLTYGIADILQNISKTRFFFSCILESSVVCFYDITYSMQEQHIM